MNFIEHCEKTAKAYFSIEKLRDSQKEVLSLIAKNKYVLATLPTGSGKTFLYAIPALISTTGTVLVISPLIALMRDQARRMQEAKICCAVFTSDQGEEEKKEAWRNMMSGEAKIIFVSPERFVMPSFMRNLEKIKLSMIVIDEAHCVMSWGHQFRPEYFELGALLGQLKPGRILALTATAGHATRLQIIQRVFPEPELVAQYISHPIPKNIRVTSQREFSLEEQFEALVDWIEKTPSQKIIVYFQSRKTCEEISTKLKRIKINAYVYHAGLLKQERVDLENYFTTTKRKLVICATVAFGMGMDLVGVGLVVVYGFPGNIEEFFQMLGRAGRGGEEAQGVLLWTGGDAAKRKFLFEKQFLTTAAFVDGCTALKTIMPKNYGDSVYVSKEKLQNLFDGRGKFKKTNSSQDLELIMAGLRICNVVSDPAVHETYYDIALAKDTSIADCLKDLPDQKTKRRLFFEGLQILTKNTWASRLGPRGIFSLKMLRDSSDLDENDLQQIFVHYASQKHLTFVRLAPEERPPGFIFKHNHLHLQKNLTHFITTRKNFSASLQELNKLSTATGCRLASSFDFFVEHRERPLSGSLKRCLQCDLCLKKG